MRFIAFTFLVVFTLGSTQLVAGGFDLSTKNLKAIQSIAYRISLVQPNLEESKYLEYATGIYKAAGKYAIDPDVLIAITQQETGFREDLPEGKAGERGICQVIKGWLKNSKFKKEFRRASIKDFHRPVKSFHFAAWILKDLKERYHRGTLPYWSYYNANKFENRFRYYLSVNRFISVLKNNDKLPRTRVAENFESEISDRELSSPKPVHGHWKPGMVFTETGKHDTTVVKLVASASASKVKRIKQEEENPWLTQAFQKVRDAQKSNPDKAQNPAIIQAAAEFDLQSITVPTVEN